MEKKGTIIVTFDDILCNNSYYYYLYCCEHYSFYGKYLNLYRLQNEKKFNERSKINWLNYLFKEFNSDKFNTSDVYRFMSNLLTMVYHGLYDVDIYKNIRPTKLYKEGILNPLLIENDGIKKIIILVKYHTEKEKQYKINFINNNFSNEKIEVKAIKYDEKYEDMIMGISDWNLLITDDVDCVDSLIAENITKKEFLLPQRGYTKLSDIAIKAAILKESTVSYY